MAKRVHDEAESRSSAARPPPVSKLIELLDRGVDARNVVKSPDGTVYSGFALFSALAESECRFTPMNSNRAINSDVVRRRVDENLEHFAKHQEYMDFGQINLIVLAGEPVNEFLVMDGQHRCETMAQLHRQNPNRHVVFQFRVKVCVTEEQAFQVLDHFQRTYPSDPRSFFRSRAETRTATTVLIQLKTSHPPAFKEVNMANREGHMAKDPDRPFMNDNILFWLLQDAGLLASGAARPGPGGSAPPPLLDSSAILGALGRMNQLMASLPKQSLGKGVSDKMLQKAKDMNMFLGFFREKEGSLHWSDLANRLQPQPGHTQSSVAAPGAAKKRKATAAETTTEATPAVETDLCCICLAEPRSHAFLPCGHRCVCEDCGKAVMAARPPTCPICREEVSNVQIVWA